MSEENDAHYMKMALLEAQKAYELGEVPVGAVFVDQKGEVISRGHNLKETLNDPTAHAEMIAIRKACEKLNNWRLDGLTIYVTMEPCPMCAGALWAGRVRRLVYGIYDTKAGAAQSLFNITNNASLNHRLLVTAGVLEEECRNILKNFFAERREIYNGQSRNLKVHSE